MRGKAAAVVASLALVVSLTPAAAFAAVNEQPGDGTPAMAKSNEGGTILASVITKTGKTMFDVSTVTDEQYNEYFKEKSAVEGVKAIIAAGKYSINDIAIPGTQEQFEQTCPEGYEVNGSKWLYQKDGKWVGAGSDRNLYDTYAEAAFKTATGIPAGLEIRILDEDSDGVADAVSADYKEGLIVGKVTHEHDGTYRIVRSELEGQYASEKVYDGAHFSSTSKESVKAENFDTSLREGDVALFWYGPNGWVVKRAVEKKGTFVDGADHQYYQIDDVQYADAMRFSRDNIIISNRNGEYTNAQKYFGLINDKRHSVSLWLVPTSQEGVYGAPIGLTSGSNSFYFLYKAIETAQSKLDAVAVSKDGKDIAKGKAWATKAAHDQLAAAIERARGVLESGVAADLMDYQTYLLYLNLHGSADDIGAKFAGFDFVGFDKQMADGTYVPAKAQSLKVSAKVKAVSKKTVAKKAVTAGKVSARGAKTAVSFKKASGSSKVSISKTGKVTVKKGTKKGTYKVTVKASAKAGKVKGVSYKAASKTVTFKVRVK